jgi:hypothetical protein
MMKYLLSQETCYTIIFKRKGDQIKRTTSNKNQSKKASVKRGQGNRKQT